MKKISFIFLMALIALAAAAQVQHGYVKTKGRMVNGSHVKGEGLPGAVVSIQGRTAIGVKNGNGSFSFPVTGKTFVLQSVSKTGYKLIDADAAPKSYNYSSNPLYLVLEKPEQLKQDKLDATRKLNATLKRQNQMLEDSIEALMDAKKISDERYYELIGQLNEYKSKSGKLVEEMAERYSMIDYDQLDEHDRQVSMLILNGQLLQADSLLRSKGTISSRIAEINHEREIENREQEELDRRQANLDQSIAGTQAKINDIAQDCYRFFECFTLHHQNDSAVHYLELRCQVDSTNIQYLFDLGDFLKDKMADYNAALVCYNKALKIASQSGKISGVLAYCYLNIGETHHYMEHFLEAQKNYEKSLEVCTQLEDEVVRTADCYNDLGVFYQTYGDDYEKAEDFFMKALEIRINKFGEIHPRVALCYSNLGAIQLDKGELEASYNYNLKSLDIRRKLYGENHPDVASSYRDVANYYSMIGDLEKAKEHYKKSINIFEEYLGENHPETASTYMNFGIALARGKDWNVGLELIRRALSIYVRVVGENSIGVAYCYNALGFVYHEQNLIPESIECLEKALDIFKNKNINGENNRNVATIYGSLGVAYGYLESYDKALDCQKKCAETIKQIYNDAHPVYANALVNMAQLYADLGGSSDALALLEKALPIFIKANLQSQIADCYDEMGYVLRDLGRYDEALKQSFAAYEIYKALFGEEHYQVGVSLCNIGVKYMDLGDYVQAKEYLMKSIDIIQAAMGEDNIKLAPSYCNLGLVAINEKQYDHAIDCLEKAYEIVEKSNGQNTTLYIIITNSIAEAYMLDNQLDSASSYMNRAKQLIDTHYKIASSEIVALWNNMGLLCVEKKDYKEAIDYFEKAKELLVKKYGDKHPKLASVEVNMGKVWHLQKKFKDALKCYNKALGIFNEFLPNGHEDILETQSIIELAKKKKVLKD